MGQTPTFALPYPEPADPADVPTDMHELCTRLEQVIGALPVVPVGAIVDWPYASGGIPSWALLCYGQAISRTSYAALHALAAAAAYPHGSGDGTSTFALPDLRGRVLAGKDDMGGTAANRITAAVSGGAGTTLGIAVGSEGVSITTAQLPAHNHGVTGTPSIAGGISAGGTGITTAGAPTGVTIAGAGTGVYIADGAGSHQHLVYAMRSGGGYGLSTANSGYKENVGVAWATGGVDVSFNTPAAGGHNHSISDPGHGHGVSDPWHAHTINDPTHGHGHTISAGVGTLGTANAGGGGVHPNTQPTLIVNKMMRAL